VGCQVLYDTAMNKPGTSFDTPDFHAVADHVAELVSGGYLLKGFEGSAWPAGQMEFVQGNAAMKSWLPGEMLANTPADFRYGFFAFPTLPDGKADQTAVQLKFNGYLVTKDAPHHAEAMLFIKKLLSRSVQERYTARSYYPGVLPGLEMPAALADTLPVLEAAQTVEGFACDLDRDKYEWETNALFPATDKLLFGQITPDEFIDQLQRDHEAFWATQ
jgi:raffinose/stachyose/melibiose transport system substrate-binding protein